MALTRRLLRELNLEDAPMERIIAAHIETVDALKDERDAARERASLLEAAAAERDELRQQLSDLAACRDDALRIQSDFDAYRAQVEADRLAATRHAALRTALLTAGANPHAADLLASAAPLPDDAWDGDSLRDPAAALAPLRQRYAALFAQPTLLPTPRIAPPSPDAPALSRDDVSRMSEQDILANWPAVQAALKG